MTFHLSQTEWWTPDRLQQHQLLQAAALIRFARENVPYYEKRFQAMKRSSPDKLRMKDFRSIPLLNREVIQTEGDGLLARAIPENHQPATDMVTSGSSGRPVRVKTTRHQSMFNQAVALRYHQWFKRDLGGSNVSIQAMGESHKFVSLPTWVGGLQTGPARAYNNMVPVDLLFEQFVRDEPVYLQCHPSVL